MRIGNNHGALTEETKKRLGNIPLRWRYDGTRLFMLFREGNSSYLIIEKAFLTGGGEDSYYRIGVTGDGAEYILKDDNMSETLVA